MNRAVVSSSTSGYCAEMGLRQYLHLPPSHSQLITGNRSWGANTCLQLGQIDLPFNIDKFLGLGFFLPCSCSRQTSALMKLPKHKPSTAKIIITITSYITTKKNRPVMGLFILQLYLLLSYVAMMPGKQLRKCWNRSQSDTVQQLIERLQGLLHRPLLYHSWPLGKY